jgi:hypothetical protein
LQVALRGRVGLGENRAHGIGDRPTSAIGILQKNTAALLPIRIGEAAVEYIQLEDGGDTRRAVQNAKKLIGEHNVAALIGPSRRRMRSPFWTSSPRRKFHCLPRLSPKRFRSARREAIEQERDVGGCQGVFEMSPTNRARVLVTVKGGKFRLLRE